MGRDVILPWRYTDEGGNVYSVGISRYIAEQLDDAGQPRIGGGTVTEATIGPLPVGLTPRHVVMQSPTTYRWRQAIAFSKDAQLWATGVHRADATGQTKTLQFREEGTLSTYKVERWVDEAYTKSRTSLFRGMEGGRFDEIGWGRGAYWRYTTDLGHSYVCLFPASVTTQVDGEGHPLVGGQPASGFAGLPNGLKPRTVTVHSAESKLSTRRLVICSVDAPLWTGSATSVELPSGDAGLVKYLVKKKNDEVWTGRARKPMTDRATPGGHTGEDFDYLTEATFWET